MVILVFVIIIGILALVDFFSFLVFQKRLYHVIVNRILEMLTVIGLPLFYFVAMDSFTNDCCTFSATFSPNHSLTIFTLIVVCITAFYCSVLKERIISPITEILINSILVGGIFFNVFLAIQIDQPMWLFGNLPILIYFIFELAKNHKNAVAYKETIDEDSLSHLHQLLWNILSSKIFVKIPILLIICLPILTIISSILLLFGQKPDSLIRAFTDTYKHGFSQLDYLCENVDCGGHFLCSVAAKGHQKIVIPERLGERGGNLIMCNRQLLVSNAFEELIQEKLPRFHKYIRRNYNKVGNMIHQYYDVFNNKWFADFIYILMKPLEWIFLLTLYTFDQNPENRISKQYLKTADRIKIDELMNN